jgi:phage repressor protein C with HTH and peptisase S24 domain
MKIAFTQHPDEALLEQYLLGQLPESEIPGVEEHLLLCHSCLNKAETLTMMIEALRAKHIRPEVQPFRTHLPQYSLEAAAGKFGEQQMEVEPEGWVRVPAPHVALTEDMFVTHVKGHSMEPKIPDGSLCAFRSNIAGSYDGKVLLVEHYGETGGNRYTVKLYRSSKNLDPHRQGDDGWLHERITLQSLNPDYPSWDVASAGTVRVIGEFLFLV